MSTEHGRAMGIDYGTKRIGVALSDPMRILASGRGVIPNSPSMFTAIADMARNEDVMLIVVGMPYAPDGGLGRKGEEVLRFIEALRQQTRIPVDTWDESMSSVDAMSSMRAGGMKRRTQREKGRVDEMAARLILQGYLDHSGMDGVRPTEASPE